MLDTHILLNILPRTQLENMAKTSKVKKKVVKAKNKTASKTRIKSVAKTTVNKAKEVIKGPIKISKTYIPKDTEKYMCE